MATYIYACPDKQHPRNKVIHRPGDYIVIFCSACGKKMSRVPQLFRWGKKPLEVLYDRLERGDID